MIKEEIHDVCPTLALHLVYNPIDVTRTKTHNPSHSTVLTALDRQARDDSWMGSMFRMGKLQLRIGGRPVTGEEMDTLAHRYSLTYSVMHMCRMGPAF